MPPTSKNKTNLKTVKPVAIKQEEQTGRQSPETSATAQSIFEQSIVMPGTFKTYRAMRENPTIALARAIANGPIQTANISVVSDEDVPENVIKFIRNQVDSLWPSYSKDVLYARDYGFQAFEKVWAAKPYEGTTRWIISKLKALTPDITSPVINKETGAFEGLRQKAVQLDIPYALWITHDAEPGQWYGRSQHENIRKQAYSHWVNTAAKQGQCAGKIAGVLPIVYYPVGKGRDATGSEKSTFDIATTILKTLGTGHGVTIPQELATWAQDMAMAGVDVEKLLSWRISFLEPKGQHARGFIDTLRHYESLMMRGWLVPERAAIEGQYGTKAEASTHASIALVIAGLVLTEFIRHFNWYIVNPLLVYNFGDEFENKVRVEREGLDPSQELFWRTIIEKVLTSPTNIDLFMTWLDIEAMLDIVGLPIRQGSMTRTAEVQEEKKTDEEGRQKTETSFSPDRQGAVAAALSRLTYSLKNNGHNKRDS